ncbi:MAG: hypothetical protein GXY17_04315 [Clostridiaceae bacterium]|nr:hypothetical protein [Clostridiaceae bacterium]
MSYLKEKVSYLKGLAEGMQISDSTNEGKLLKAIIAVLDDIAIEVDDIAEIQDQISEQVDEIDEDLGEIEGLLYDVDDDDDDDDECDCAECVDEEVCNAQFDCPHCEQTINLMDAYMKKDSVLCPHCHKDIEIEWSCDCEDCAEGEDDTED